MFQYAQVRTSLPACWFKLIARVKQQQSSGCYDNHDESVCNDTKFQLQMLFVRHTSNDQTAQLKVCLGSKLLWAGVATEVAATTKKRT